MTRLPRIISFIGGLLWVTGLTGHAKDYTIAAGTFAFAARAPVLVAVRISPGTREPAEDSRVLSSTNWIETATIYDLPSMRIRRRFTVQDMEDQVPFAPVALSADGHQLAILRRDSKIDVYDVRSGSVVQHLPQPPDFPYAIGISVSFSPDNSLLGVAYGGSDSFAKNSVAFFDRADGHKIRTIRNHSGLSFSPNGTKILSFGEHSLDAVDVRSGRVARVARARPTAVNLFAAWSQDGSIAAAIVRDPNWRSPCPPNVPHTDSCSNVDHEIVIVDIRSRRVRRTIGGPDQRVAQRPLTFSPGGVLIAPLGGATARYRVSNGLWSYVAPLSPLALSADGRWAVVQGCSQTSVALQDPERARAIPFAALGCR